MTHEPLLHDPYVVHSYGPGDFKTRFFVFDLEIVEYWLLFFIHKDSFKTMPKTYDNLDMNTLQAEQLLSKCWSASVVGSISSNAVLLWS